MSHEHQNRTEIQLIDKCGAFSYPIDLLDRAVIYRLQHGVLEGIAYFDDQEAAIDRLNCLKIIDYGTIPITIKKNLLLWLGGDDLTEPEGLAMLKQLARFELRLRGS